MTDPISDLFIRIKNAYLVSHSQVLLPYSRMKFDIAKILKNSGYISNFEKKTKKIKKTEHDYILLTLKYSDGFPAMTDVKIISKPSRRMYAGVKNIKPVRSGHGISIISTSKGIMDSRQAKKDRLGGEVVCEVW